MLSTVSLLEEDPPEPLAAALPALRRAGLGPLRIYLQRGGDFQEVSL